MRKPALSAEQIVVVIILFSNANTKISATIEHFMNDRPFAIEWPLGIEKFAKPILPPMFKYILTNKCEQTLSNVRLTFHVNQSGEFVVTIPTLETAKSVAFYAVNGSDYPVQIFCPKPNAATAETFGTFGQAKLRPIFLTFDHLEFLDFIPLEPTRLKWQGNRVVEE